VSPMTDRLAYIISLSLVVSMFLSSLLAAAHCLIIGSHDHNHARRSTHPTVALFDPPSPWTLQLHTRDHPVEPVSLVIVRTPFGCARPPIARIPTTQDEMNDNYHMLTWVTAAV
jgi:hypothetical protein